MRSATVAPASVSGLPGVPYIRRAQRGRLANASVFSGGTISFSARNSAGTSGW
jgi:hypothetical protein